MLARINLISEEVKTEGGTFGKRGSPPEKACVKGKCFIGATDVEALFPSLGARSSARICKEQITNSSIIVQNFDVEETLLY